MLRRTLLPYALVAVAACVPSDQEPLTAADRCALLCELKDSRHPCIDEPVAPDCESTCAAHIEGLAGDCLPCVLNNSGWIGSTCECEEVDEFGQVQKDCQACEYTTHQRGCVPDNANCNTDSATCEGFTLIEPDGSLCSQACSGS